MVMIQMKRPLTEHMILISTAKIFKGGAIHPSVPPQIRHLSESSTSIQSVGGFLSFSTCHDEECKRRVFARFPTSTRYIP